MSDSEDNASSDSGDFSPPTSINPYAVLGIPPTATVTEVRTAYRRLALQTHPDKVAPVVREAAHVKFQEIAFAYAVINDPDRRARYDATGNTSENVFEEGFDWKEFFSNQAKDLVNPEAVEKFKKEYQGSDEERAAVLQAYTDNKGSLDKIFQYVMVSSVLDDEDRFCAMIREAIDAGEVKAYRAFTNESAKSKKVRKDLAESEKKEAEEYAKELGVWDVLFGEKKKRKEEQEAAEADDAEMRDAEEAEEDEDEEIVPSTGGKGKGRGRTAKKTEPAGRSTARAEKRTKAKKEDDTSALENLIKNRQANRNAAFLASLEAKYGVNGSEVKKEKKGKKTARGKKVDGDLDEEPTTGPTEEESQAAKKIEGRAGKKRTGDNGKAENITVERRSKRNKP